MATPNVAAATPHPPTNFKSAVKGGQKDSTKPKGPDKPLMPYMRFTKQVWDQVRDQYPHMKVWEISKVIGSMWKVLPDKEKQVYIDSFEIDKVKYEEQLKIFHASPVYQTWLASSKIAAVNKENETTAEIVHPQTPQTAPLQMARKDKKYLNSPQKQEGKVCLQIPELDFPDDDDYFSGKHLAAARFYRNHKLMYDILNETDMQLARPEVSKERITMLRNHVEALSSYTKRIERDIELDVARFEARKRDLLDSNERFHRDYSQLVKRMASSTTIEANKVASTSVPTPPATTNGHAASM